MNDQHLGESLELYALGALDRDEQRAAEEHLATCGECSRLLAAAESTVAGLDALTVPMFEAPAELATRIASIGKIVVPLRARKPFDVARWGTLAACVAAVAVGITGAREVTNDRATIAADDHALSAIAASHFAHTTFTKLVPDAPTTKVLWGKSPLWLYVIVDSSACGCEVVELTKAGERDLGAPIARGATATLFVDDAPEATGVELRSGTRLLATAKHP